MNNTMTLPSQAQEQICKFGQQKNLLGVLTTPTAGEAVPQAPFVIILNAGIIHHIGPFRLHVQIARELATAGFSTLRMDLSGLGESPVRTGKTGIQERSIMDIKDTMDYLQQEHGAESFVLIGLCSGAFNAHQVAAIDDRVAGAVFLDGIVFRTLSYLIKHNIGRLLKPRFWKNAIKRRIYFGSNHTAGEDSPPDDDAFFWDDLDQDKITLELEGMLQRGMQMLVVYTGGYDDVCSAKQFKEMFGIAPNQQLQVNYLDKAEHTFRLLENRSELLMRIRTWMCEQFS